MKREDFIEKCRSYIGTPFKHQARLPGVGIDCAGVIICAGKELGVDFQDLTNYSRKPRSQDIIDKLYSSGFTDVLKEDVKVGDIGLVAYEGNVQHIVIITELEPIYILHAVNDKAVIEHRNNLNIVRYMSYPFED